GVQSERVVAVVGEYAQPLGGSADDWSKPVAQRARALRSAAQEVAVVRRIVARRGPARLHRLHHDPWMHHNDARRVRGACDDAIDLFRVGLGIRRHAGPVDCDVAGSLRPDLRRALANGLAQGDHRSALLLLDWYE